MKLFFFTNSYPYGFPDNWKTIELNEFIRHFQDITIFPFSDGGSPGVKIDLPKNIQVLSPMLRSRNFVQAFQTLLKTVFSPLPIYFLREFVSAKGYASVKRLKLWVRSSYYTAAIYFHPEFRRVLSETDESTTWYFYWGNHMALVIPLIRKKVRKIFCRVHNSDVYKEATTGYLPYQRRILENTDLILPCSEDGKKYIEANFGSEIPKVEVARLGVILQRDRVKITSDSTFKFVSCSSLCPTKRLQIIADALQYLDFPIHWTHVGAGTELEEFVQNCKQYENAKVKVRFTGYMKHEQIIPFYLAENFQLLVNVSSWEGIPVSIMEAMSVGIPAMATNVGGTGELVNENVGVLLPSSVNSKELANQLSTFRKLSEDTRLLLSSNSIRRVEELYDGEANARRLMQLFQTAMQ